MGMKVDQATFDEWVRKGLIPPLQPQGPLPTGEPAKRSKYRNTKVEVEGFEFDSKKEARRWLDLREQQRAGAITDLRRQVEFELRVNGELICVYVADSAYRRNGERIVEDVKSIATRKLPVYRIKVKLMRALLGIEVQEV